MIEKIVPMWKKMRIISCLIRRWSRRYAHGRTIIAFRNSSKAYCEGHCSDTVERIINESMMAKIIECTVAMCVFLFIRIGECFRSCTSDVERVWHRSVNVWILIQNQCCFHDIVLHECVLIYLYDLSGFFFVNFLEIQ